MKLEQFLEDHAEELRKKVSLEPLFRSGDPVPGVEDLPRKLYPAQRDVVGAIGKLFEQQKSCLFVGEQGVGKTSITSAACHLHAKGKPYRGLVMCPGHLVSKWPREITETLGVENVTVLRRLRDVVGLSRAPPKEPEWYVISKDRAKLKPSWSEAFSFRMGHPCCPRCGEFVEGKSGKHKCVCGEKLWGWTGRIKRWPVAWWVRDHLKGYFDYFIPDEQHQLQKPDTSQGEAFGALVSACKYTVACTGTLTGGRASDLRPTIFRMNPRAVVDEFEWSRPLAFAQEYGRVETVFRESGGNVSKRLRPVPGIMPHLFGKVLIGNTIFLSLDQVSEGLPGYQEELMGVAMGDELRESYTELEGTLRSVVREMLASGDRRMLGAMLNTLLAYPDIPDGWGPVGYGKGKGFVPIARPRNIAGLQNKERRLLELCQEEKLLGRKVWVFTQFTDKHDVAGRIGRLLEDHGFRVAVLRASVSPEKRERWLARHGPDVDVVVSHPQLVETGVDFFDKQDGEIGIEYNFPTIIFLEQPTSLYMLRQASRRGWRLCQTEDCRVYFLYYTHTLQEKLVNLLGKKLKASQALEGRFSVEGLAAMGDSVELELARRLVYGMAG